MCPTDEGFAYDVGFGKPPKETRFRKGRSGNPNGRPKGKVNAATALERALQEKTVIRRNGKDKPVTKLEAAIEQLVNKALAGDLPALRLLIAFSHPAEQPVDADASPSESDLLVMQTVLKRYKGTTEDEGNDAQ